MFSLCEFFMILEQKISLKGSHCESLRNIKGNFTTGLETLQEGSSSCQVWHRCESVGISESIVL